MCTEWPTTPLPHILIYISSYVTHLSTFLCCRHNNLESLFAAGIVVASVCHPLIIHDSSIRLACVWRTNSVLRAVEKVQRPRRIQIGAETIPKSWLNANR